MHKAAPSFEPVETSKLSGIFVRDCLAADVQISRRAGCKEWKLAANLDAGRRLEWRTRFATELDAWDHFITVVNRYGMETVAGPMPVAIEALQGS